MKNLNSSSAIVMVLFAVLLALFAVTTIIQYASPWDGAEVSSEGLYTQPQTLLLVEARISHPGAIRDGDILTAVEGVPVQEWIADTLTRRLARPEWEVGRTAAYTILRDGLEMDVQQPLIRYPLGAVFIDNWGLWVFVGGTLLVASFAFSRRPDVPALRVLLLFAAILPLTATASFGVQVTDFISGSFLTLGALLYLAAYPLISILVTHFLLVFPTTQPWLVGRRWVIVLLYVVPAVVISASILLSRPSFTSLEWMENAGRVIEPISTLYGVVFIPLAAILAYVTVRDPVSRAHVRWLVLVVVFNIVLSLAAEATSRLVNVDPVIWDNLVVAFALTLPISIVVIILRYRLYEIDVIIRRTTQYAIVTALLVLVYFGSVVFLQRLFATVTGQTSTIAVVLSTLLIAALFLPVRRRVQDVVDRRFFRRKYDAEKVLNEFAATVRDETDLDSLTAELERVIQETMQPEFVSVWLMPEAKTDPKNSAHPMNGVPLHE